MAARSDLTSPSIDPPPNPRFRRGRGRRYIPDVVERVRVLVEGTGLSQGEIAARIGVSQSTVWRLMQRRGWQRPAEAAGWTRLIATERSGLSPQIAAALGRLAALAEREAAAGGEAGPDGAGAGAAAEGLARRCRRLAGHLGKTGDRSAPRLVRPGPRRRDRPRRESLVEEARDLVESTALRQSDIARRLGISRQTLVAWKQTGGWARRADAPSPYGGPASGPRGELRMGARIEARARLAAAEGRLAALEGGRACGNGELAEVAALVFGAVRVLQRPVGPLPSPLAAAGPSGEALRPDQAPGRARVAAGRSGPTRPPN